MQVSHFTVAHSRDKAHDTFIAHTDVNSTCLYVPFTFDGNFKRDGIKPTAKNVQTAKDRSAHSEHRRQTVTQLATMLTFVA